MKRLLLLALLLPSCAHTDLYDPATGQRLARFEGDMTGMTYHRAADGSVKLTGSIDHSSATRAQGEAASSKLGAAGTAIAAAGAMTLIP